MSKNYFFKEKIKCIYEHLAKKSLTELTRLFWIENSSTTFENRKLHIQKKWLEGKEAFIPRKFKSEFNSYPFNRLFLFDNKPLFADATEFLEISKEEFCRKIYEYINSLEDGYLQDKDKLFHYFYMYRQDVFKTVKNSIGEYQIFYKKLLRANEYEIEVISTINSDFRYNGRVFYKKNKLIIHFENSWNYITIVANLEFLNAQTKYLIGIISGFSQFNQKVPSSKKVILTRQKALDYDRLYLTLNETESIYAEENSYKYNVSNFDYLRNHFIKYTKKLENFDKFLNNLKKQEFFALPYYNLAFNEFHSVTKIFQKLANNNSYYVKDRYHLFLGLFDEHFYHKFDKLFIVLPIYTKYFIFNHFSDEAQKILKIFQRLYAKKVKIEIVFLINNCKRALSEQFHFYLQELIKIAEISFCSREPLLKQESISSIDFVLAQYEKKENKKEEFVAYKPFYHYRQIFVFSQDPETIKRFKTTYNFVKFKATPYKEPFLLQDYCLKQESSKLSGEWFKYTAGTKQLWEEKIKIYDDEKVECYYNNKLSSKGEIIHKTFQSVMILEDIETRRITTYMFDNKSYILGKAFFMTMLSKAYKQEDEIFSIALFSKDPIPKEKVLEIIGESYPQFLSYEIKKRLSDYLFERYEKN